MLVLFFFLLPFDKPPAPERQEAVSKPTHDPTNIEELYQAYRYFGLPLPPKGSFLAKRLKVSSSLSKVGTVELSKYDLYFLVSADDPKFESQKRFMVKPLWKEVESLRIPPDDMRIETTCLTSEWLVFAAMSHHLGWNELAKKGFEKGTEESRESNEQTPILNELKERAWSYHRDKLLAPKTNRAVILTELRKTFVDERSEVLEHQKEFDRNLSQSLVRRWDRKGSAEELINGLITGESTMDDLIAKGFDAVPALIRHISDKRLMKDPPSDAIRCFASEYVTVGSVCIDILRRISVGEAERFHCLQYGNQQDFFCLRAMQAEEWFRNASLYGEEKWCLINVFSEGAHDDLKLQLNPDILKIIQLKHPQMLKRIVERCLRHQQFPQPILHAIATSRLPKKEKDDLISKAIPVVKKKNWLRLVETYSYYDAEECRKQLRQYLLDVEKGSFQLGDCHEGIKSELVLLYEMNDAECWRVFRKILPKLDVVVRERLTYIQFRPRYDYAGNRLPVSNHSEQLKCLLTLIDDNTQIPTDNKDSSSFVYVCGYLELKIGDLAALKIAEELDFDIPWKLERTQDEWKTVRADAKAKAEKAIKEKE